MTPEMVPVEKLVPHPKNSRTHSQDQINALARAINEWGFLQPVVADEHFVVLIGHGRVEAAKALGLASVPCIIRKGLSDANKRALLISDNRLAEKGSRWDNDALTDELRYLLGEDYDITLTAFDLAEVREEEAAAPLPSAGPVSLQGDVWGLGAHRLVCGDAAFSGPVAAATAGATPALLVTWCGWSDEETAAGALSGALGRVDAPVAYVWCQPLMGAVVAEALQGAAFELKGQIVIPRAKPAGGTRYRQKHFLGWYAVRKGAAAGWLGGRSQATVWDDAPAGRGGLPLDCWTRPIQNHAKRGGMIYDPFAEAGDGLIAAQQCAKVFAGCDEDPAYVDAAVTRWEAFTGLEAINGGTGRTFAETRQDRGASAAAG